MTAARARRTLPQVAYVDSSAIVKQIIEEAESAALERWLAAERPRAVTSRIAWIEVPRAARVAAGSAGLAPARAVLAEHDTLELTPFIANEAARIADDDVRSLDAIHLVSALVCAADVLVTYDHRLARAARHHGLRVAHPGFTPGR